MGTSYFVRRTFHSDRPGMYGWECVDTSMADKATALAELDKPAPRGTINREVFSFNGKKVTKLA